jgi:WD40 repeat protein
MSRIFISHSSGDNAAAVALKDWLLENGWSDVFLDLDPDRGIRAGERWERALHDAAYRCQAIIFLVSRNWLASQWCGKEFDLAAKLNKRMFGVLIDDFAIRDLPPRFTDTWQFTNLAAGQDHEVFRAILPPDDREAHVTFSRSGLRRLKAGLQAAGLDPRFFEWPPQDDPDRAPYTGLPPMEEADAGIFFGREADIVRALDDLRGLARRGPPRLFVIEGASGCGKSSFLRAGLIPRLRRDSRSYLVLPTIRPEQAAIDGARGLVAALTAAFAKAGAPRNRADLREVAGAPERLETALADLAGHATVPAMPGEAETRPPAVVVPIDQAEELFQSAGREQGRRLLGLLSTVIRSRSLRLVVVFTIRTDDYEPLQTAAEFEGMAQHIFGLAPIPIGRLGSIIEGPARRVTESTLTDRRLTIDPALVARLLQDLQQGAAADVMPLCAFILERLWRDYGADGKLTLAEYESAEQGLGGIRGAIEGAVAAAFAEPERAPAIPRDPDARAALLRRAMIPALAAIDPETRTPRRRVARMSEIPEDARALVERLVEARLLTTDLSPGMQERTVEPAHEALLRQWTLMETWLQEDARDLLVLDGVERAASDWQEHGAADAWLAHSGGRLEDAERLRRRADFAARLSGAQGAYLDACHAAETARRDRELADARRIAAAETAQASEARRRMRATRAGLLVSLLLLVVAGAAAISAAISNGRLTATNDLLAATNDDLAESKAAADAAADAARAAQRAAQDSAAQAEVQRERADAERRRAELGQIEALVSASAAQLPGSDDRDGLAALVDGLEAATKIEAMPDIPPVLRDRATETLRRAISGVWERNRLDALDGRVIAVAASPDGARFGAVDTEGTIALWSRSGALLKTIRPGSADIWVSSASFDDRFDRVAMVYATTTPDGSITPDSETRLTVWDLDTGEGRIVRDGPRDWAYYVDFAAGGTLLATSWRDTTSWWTLDGAPVRDPVTAQVEFEMPSERRSRENVDAVFEGDDILSVWHPAFSEPLSLDTRQGWIDSWTFAPDGYGLLTGGRDGTVRLWDLRPKTVSVEIPAAQAMAVALSRDRIATADRDGHIRLLSSDGAPMRDIPAPTGNYVPRLASGFDGRFAAILRDRSALLLDADGEVSLRSQPAWRETLGAGFLENGDFWLASLLGDSVVFRDAAGVVQSTTPPLDPGIWRVVRSGDGAFFATLNGAGGATVRDGAGTEVFRFPPPTLGLVFRPASREFATAGRDGYVRLWDGEGGELHAFPNFLNGATIAAFSPDGEVIATAGLDGTARIWNVDSRQMLQACASGRQGQVFDLAFDPSGTLMTMVANDGSLHQCRLDSLGDLVDRACDWVGDYLRNGSGVEDRHRGLCSR